MSKVDDVFDFADELIDEWGHYVTFVRKENSIYDPETGSTTETETRQQVKVVISKLDISEYGGLYQQNDVKIILDPVQVNYIYITDQDYFLVPRENAPDEMMKVIEARHLPRRPPCGLRHHREAAVMANIGKLIGTSLEAYANEVTEAIHAEAAVDIVKSLKYFGPYWTGEFQDNWVILKGDSRAKRRPSEQKSRNKKPKTLTLGPQCPTGEIHRRQVSLLYRQRNEVHAIRTGPSANRYSRWADDPRYVPRPNLYPRQRLVSAIRPRRLPQRRPGARRI